jgi:ABC-type uncharacterized transport system ATPase subunit
MLVATAEIEPEVFLIPGKQTYANHYRIGMIPNERTFYSQLTPGNQLFSESLWK